MRNIFLVLTILLLSSPLHTLAQDFNAGFIEGLWYNQEPFFAGESVRIYAAIRNNTGADLTGTVKFYIDGSIIESVRVSALDGRIIEAWADWTATYGTSSISASLTRTEISGNSGNEQSISVTAAKAAEAVFADYDTDKDGVGNIADIDDDNDGITDEEEIAAGSDPLKANIDTEYKTDDTKITQGNTTTQNTIPIEWNSDDPQGLEQYLEENRADAAFTVFTNGINNTKKRLDEYRAGRQSETDGAEESTSDSSAPSASPIATNTDTIVTTDSFGEIERSQGEAKSGSWFSTATNALGAIINAVYTLLLTALSFFLGFPALVELFLLILILYLLYRTAKKFGSRPQ